MIIISSAGKGRRKGGSKQAAIRFLQSEKGVVLIVALVLSAVALILITTLLYIITIGTQASGLQKKYRTAVEAGVAGSEVLIQAIMLSGDISTLAGLNPQYTISSACSGASILGDLYSAETAAFPLVPKIMTSSTTWSPECNKSLRIDTKNPETFDLKFEVGTKPTYTVYTKIVSAVEGNTAANSAEGAALVVNGVSASPSTVGGEVAIQTIPYLYTMEVEAENSVRPDERARFSVLYQF